MPKPTLSIATERPIATLIAYQRLWPSNRRYPGIAHDWHGSAWVAFKLADAGLPVPGAVFAAVDRRLTNELGSANGTEYFGAFLGCTAAAVIAGYAVRQGIVSRAIARQAYRRVANAMAHSPEWDVQMGLAGALLGLAEIAAVEPSVLGEVRPTRPAARLLAVLDELCKRPPHGWLTGMAHGLAGAIVAAETCGALGWCRISTTRRQRWIDALVRCAIAMPDGAVLWPMMAGAPDLGRQSWCAGTPGIALALLQCFRLTREPAYLDFARAALDGVQALSRKPLPSRTLCCGNAGFRHIFLEAHCVTGEPGWLSLAAVEARYSSTTRRRPRLGLFQGELGIAYLAERRRQPHALPLPGLGPSSASPDASAPERRIDAAVAE